MPFIIGILHNPLFIAPALSWCIAQITKTIIYVIINHEFRAERIFGAGGMPSSHSATTCALVAATACVYGSSGFELPMAFFFAFIVMYDAMGVRRETGEQAKVLNEMIADWRQRGKQLTSLEPMAYFKEFVGHTPLQVFFGAVLGVAVGLITCHCLGVI
ncbi:MAG TPA: hypothetical protein DGX96_02860 [Lachnospiraceae bacterium]|jgi:acid phosphatase family membrane protein YuiD|nr:hypothetical protein [Lachnospiraceae bacterium]